MTSLEPFQSTVPIMCRFSSRADLEDDYVVTLDQACAVVTKPIFWSSAGITLDNLDPATIDPCAINLPERFTRCAVWNFSPGVDLAWRKIEPRRVLVVAAGHHGVFSPTFSEFSEPEIPINTAAIRDEAREEGFQIPTNRTLRCAELISSKLSRVGVMQSEVEIYPMPNGEVAIDIFRGREGDRSSIIFLCGSTGYLQCLTHINGKNDQRRIRLEVFPDDFVHQALEELMEVR